MTQDDALTILKTGANVFLTGEPGSGKTYTINNYISYLKQHSIDPVITASTGIAATHIGGVTIHSWSGIGARDYISTYDIDRIASTEYIAKKVSKAKVLIIDEISMLSGSVLNALDFILQSIRGTEESFGGLQVIFVGDFFQLPPIKKPGSPDDFAFSSVSWKNTNIVVCYLEEQHRHAESDLFHILSAARNGNLEDEHWQMLKTKYTDIKDIKNETKLFTHNKEVDILNTEKLEKLKGKKHFFPMKTKGSTKLTATIIKGCLSPENLELKLGAVVMCTKNNPGRGFVNGTLGTVVSFGTNGGYPVIQTNHGKEILVEPMSWQIEEDGKVKAEVTQVPLRHAWAITVHKSQGMTLTSAAIDLSRSFEYGQGYVALSRLSSLSGLELIGINKNSLSVHPKVKETDEYFRTESRKSESFLMTTSSDEIKKLANQFIKFCGGNLVTDKKNKPEKFTTQDTTLHLLKKELKIDIIAKERGLKLNTIIDHIYVLYERGDITMHELLATVSPYLSKGLNSIYKAFDTVGVEKLSPVYEYLKGEYSYDDLKLARIIYNAIYN